MAAIPHITKWSHRRDTITLAAFHLVWIVGIMLWYNWAFEAATASADALIRPAAVLFLAFAIWCIWTWVRCTRKGFDPYMLFLLAAIAFNGGQVILEVFHANKKGVLDHAFTPEMTLNTIFVVTIGLACFHFGALASAARRYSPPPQQEKTARQSRLPSARQVRFVGWVLLGMSSVPATLLLKNAVTIVVSSGYGALYQQQSATGFAATGLILANFIVPAALFLVAGSKDSRAGRRTSAAVIMLYAVIELFLGFRYFAIMPVVAWLWLWNRTIRPLPKALLIGGGLFMLVVVFPVISATRTTAGAERTSLSYLTQAYGSINNPLVAIVSEMGGSMGTVAHTVTLVPAARSFDKGESYYYGALAVVPNLFWDLHPSIVHGTASDWLVINVDPTFALEGGGLGYSFIAEAYLNFGWYGVTLLLCVIGYLYGWFVLWADRSNDLAKLAMIGSFISFFVFFTRGESADVIRPLIWYSLIPYVLVRLVVHLEIKSDESAPTKQRSPHATPILPRERGNVS